jgi:hypothetical protein
LKRFVDQTGKAELPGQSVDVRFRSVILESCQSVSHPSRTDASASSNDRSGPEAGIDRCPLCAKSGHRPCEILNFARRTPSPLISNVLVGGSISVVIIHQRRATIAPIDDVVGRIFSMTGRSPATGGENGASFEIILD